MLSCYDDGMLKRKEGHRCPGCESILRPGLKHACPGMRMGRKRKHPSIKRAS
jgi:hypothetical protein